MDDWREEIKKLWESAGETITDAEFLEIRRQEREITTAAIFSDAAAGRPFESIDDAETSLCRFGHDYAAIWLLANDARLSDPYIRYHVTLSAYSEAPYRSITKKTIIDLAKIRPADYLKGLAASLSDPVTVYRGGIESTAAAANCALSWTTSRETADFFCNRLFGTGHLWRAQIYRRNIIAYYNGRNENEIIQYKKLHDIKQIERGS